MVKRLVLGKKNGYFRSSNKYKNNRIILKALNICFICNSFVKKRIYYLLQKKAAVCILF